MGNKMLNTPILFLVFNRLDTTKRVFAKIREIQPRQLFIGSDGAREGKKGESEKVEAVRKYILENIDWDCEIKTLFRDRNLGCGLAVSQAITWFFEQVEQGIILEDDCLPDLSFFGFCEELLNYYKDDDRVMHITGSNFQKKKWGEESYYFSEFATPIWGWATWKRSWLKYNFKITDAGVFFDSNESKKKLIYKKVNMHYYNEIQRVVSGEIDTWDYQWAFAIWTNNGLSIIPNQNLISNIGFGEDSTHTTKINKFSHLPTNPFKEKIVHPKSKKLYKNADKYIFKYFLFGGNFWINRIRTKIRYFLKFFIQLYALY